MRIIKPLTSKLKDFYALTFPKGKVEWMVFGTVLFLFSLLSYFLAMNYRIIFDNRIPWDAYFSFDNRAIVMTGGGFERHPLANYFFDAIRAVALWFSDGKMNATFRWVLAWGSTLATSFSVLYVFKYLKNILSLSNAVSVALSFFFCAFSTNILLSFTPETYPYSQSAILLFFLYASQQIQRRKKLSVAALSLGTVCIGGLTITNAVKVYIPLLFEQKIWKNVQALGHGVWKIVVSTGIFILLVLNRLDFDLGKLFSKATAQYEKFSQPKVTPLWDMILSWFVGGNMLFPNFITRDYYNGKTGFPYKALFMDVYSSFFNYLWVGIILVLVIWAVIRNRKHALIWILVLSLLVDVIIHGVMKFGLHTAYIYGGHFIFIIPMLIGWLLFSYRSNAFWRNIILSCLGVLTAYLVMNNLYRMQEFLFFLELYHLA